MKQVFLTTVSLILFINLPYSQQGSGTIDDIPSDDLTLNGMVVLGEDISVLDALPFSPDNSFMFFNELSDVWTKQIEYPGLIVQTIDNKIELVEIHDNEATNDLYVFSIHDIQIGDSARGIRDVFPVSFANKSATQISVSVNHEDRWFLTIVFDEAAPNRINTIRVITY